MPDDPEHRCRTCARFVRVIETISRTGEVRRAGECLLGVWPSPLYETSTCSQWVLRGTFQARTAPDRAPRPRSQTASRAGSTPRSLGVRIHRADGSVRAIDRGEAYPGVADATTPHPTTHHRAHVTHVTRAALPEDLLDMDADDFRRVLSQVIRDELGVGEVDMAGKWEGGEMILKAGKDGLQDKHIPLDSLFRKIITIRDKLRVLEQRINSHPKLGDDDKVQLQQYVTGCYGSLTTFNVLFADREDQFVGQKGDE
jgi:hypothetical protein